MPGVIAVAVMGFLHYVKEFRPLHRVSELRVSYGVREPFKERSVQQVVGVASSVDDNVVSVLINELIKEERDREIGRIDSCGSSGLRTVTHHGERKRLVLEGEGTGEIRYRADGQRFLGCRTLGCRAGSC